MVHYATLVDLITQYHLMHRIKDALPNCWTAILVNGGADRDCAKHAFARIEWARECLHAPGSGSMMLVKNNTIVDEQSRWTCLYWNRNDERPDSLRLWWRAMAAISIPKDLDTDMIQVARPLLSLPWPERIESYEQEQEDPHHSHIHRMLLYVHQCCRESGDAMRCEYVERSLGGERVGVLRPTLKSATDQICHVFWSWAIEAIDRIPTIRAACEELASYFRQYGKGPNIVRYEISEIGYTLAARFSLLAEPLIGIDTSLQLHQEACSIMEKMHSSNNDDVGRLAWDGHLFCERWRELLSGLADGTVPRATEPKSKQSTKRGRPPKYEAEHERRVLADQKASGMTLPQYADASGKGRAELEAMRSRVKARELRERKKLSS